MLSPEETKGLLAALTSSRPTGTTRTEVECRFWPRTNQGITSGAFERLRKHLSGRGETITSTADHSQTLQGTNNVLRKTIASDGGISWMVKNKIWHVDSKYGFRVALNLETTVAEPSNFFPTSVRKKTRYSYPVRDFFRADLTMVTGPEAGDTNPMGRRSPRDTGEEMGRSSFEVELEVLDHNILSSEQGRTDFSGAIYDILTVLYDTNKPYTRDEYGVIVRYVRDMLTGARGPNVPPDEMSFFMVYQARNLRATDMVSGGLVPHPQVPTHNRYTVTHKTDGTHKILVVHTSGIWMIMAPDEANLIFTAEEQPEAIAKYSGTMLDGELIDIPISQRRKGASAAKYWFLAFDCLTSGEGDSRSSLGNTDIMNKPHTIRMDHARYLADGFKEGEVLRIETKKFYPVPGHVDRGVAGFVNPSQFFEIMREREAELAAMTYDTDGYVFTPIGPLYPRRNDIGRNLESRTLVSTIDVCKWKPHQRLSIDFAFFRIDGKPVLYSGGIKERHVPFVGSKDNPFDGEVEDAPLTANIPPGTTVEYIWHDGMFRPVKIRTNKPRPNRVDVAIDTWNLIRDPIRVDTLTGRDFTLLFRYHNTIKRTLLAQSRGTLLDIGSGRGGDISKWRAYSRVVAVEPDDKHIAEFVSRYKTPLHVATTKEEAERMGREAFQSGHKVFLVKARGEDSDTITAAVSSFIGGKVTTISMMLSMSFFWKSPEILGGLVDTIRKNSNVGTKILYLTIDGDLVEQMFSPVFGGLRGSFDGRANIQYFPDDRSLTVTLSRTSERPSIVENQTEWLVHLDDMASALGLELPTDDVRHRADKESFLDPEGYNLTKMYTYGVWTIKTSPSPLPIASADAPIETKEAKPVPRPELPPLPAFIKPIRSASIREEVALPAESAPLRRRREVLQRRRRLPPLPVTYIGKESRGDDVVEVVPVSWFNKAPVVRISTIGSFFDAYLKGWYPAYANNGSYSERHNIVQNFRRDLAYSLYVVDPSSNKTYYETAASGFLPAMAKAANGSKYKVEEIWRVLNSSEPVSREICRYAVEMVSTTDSGERGTGIGVAFFVAMSDDLVSKGAIGSNLPMVFIAGDSNHYELLGVDNGVCGIQTLFFPGDDLVLAYAAKKSSTLISTALADVDSYIRILSAVPSRAEVERAFQRKGLCEAEREVIRKVVVIDDEDRRRMVAIRRDLASLDVKTRGFLASASKGETLDREGLENLTKTAVDLREEARKINEKY